MGSISSALNSINVSLLSEIQAFSTSGIPAGKTSPTEAGASPDQVSLSQAGTLFQQLQQLQTSNPTEFKQVLTDAAGKLQTAASQQTNPNDAAFLNNLSGRFQTAATTGDLSALHPQSPSASTTASGSTSGSTGADATHGHHRGHHAGGGGDDSLTSSSSTSQTAQNDLLNILNSLGVTQNNGQIQNLLAAFVTSSAGGGLSA